MESNTIQLPYLRQTTGAPKGTILWIQCVVRISMCFCCPWCPLSLFSGRPTAPRPTRPTLYVSYFIYCSRICARHQHHFPFAPKSYAVPLLPNPTLPPPPINIYSHVPNHTVPLHRNPTPQIQRCSCSRTRTSSDIRFRWNDVHHRIEHAERVKMSGRSLYQQWREREIWDKGMLSVYSPQDSTAKTSHH